MGMTVEELVVVSLGCLLLLAVGLAAILLARSSLCLEFAGLADEFVALREAAKEFHPVTIWQRRQRIRTRVECLQSANKHAHLFQHDVIASAGLANLIEPLVEPVGKEIDVPLLVKWSTGLVRLLAPLVPVGIVEGAQIDLTNFDVLLERSVEAARSVWGALEIDVGVSVFNVFNVFRGRLDIFVSHPSVLKVHVDG